MNVEIAGRRYRDVAEMVARLSELDAEHAGQTMPEPARKEWNKLSEVANELRSRMEWLRELSGRPGLTEAGAAFHSAQDTSRRADEPLHVRASRDAGLRTIERYTASGELRAEAADSLDDLVRSRDPLGLGARYLDAAGDPDYATAFAKIVVHGEAGAATRMTSEEITAVQKVTRVEQERALAEGTGSAGGYAVPITIDPTVILTSASSLNPVRQVARVIQNSTSLWRGVTSDGVTAEFGAEASEVADATPTLAQPEIKAERGDAFLPYSMELGQDWSSLLQEMGKLISDARDQLESSKFFNGSGTNEPFGILASSGGLTTTQRVLTAGTASFAIADVYTTKAAVPARFKANTSWLANPDTVDVMWRLVAAGSTDNAAIMNDARDRVLGQPVLEWTALGSASFGGTTTTGTKVAVVGDIRTAYTVVDRIGVQLEVIPHLFGASRRPTGQRGLLAVWRTGAKVVAPNAARYLEAK